MWILPSTVSPCFPVLPGSTWVWPSLLETCASSLTWRGKPTPAKSWLRAWKKKIWIQRLFGRTCPPLMADRFVDWWTSSLADSRAKTSPLQGSRQELVASAAGSGSSISASSMRFDLDWSSLKTSRRSSRVDSKSSSPILPRSGSMRSGALSELPMLEPRIGEIESSSWPTATVGDSHGSGSHGYGKTSKSTGKTRSEGTTLTDAAVRLWQTPRATDGDKGGPNQTLKGKPALVNQARNMWPTATTHNAKDTLMRKSPELTAVSLTLRAQMTSTGGPRSLPKDRTLNPRFVEWLMGWPIGWTDCDSQVTEWFLLRPLTRSDNSSVAS
jgi:hypothetical protein